MSRQGEARKPTIENIKDFWNKEATEWGESPRVTIRDHYMRLHEVGLICERVKGRKNVLDIGCGTGFSTMFYSQHVDKIRGEDFAENMVKWAQRLLDDPEYYDRTMGEYAVDGKLQKKANISFGQGDVTAIGHPDNSFDAVIAERLLINLPEYPLQDKATTELARIVQPGGLAVVTEVTTEGHAGIDASRAEFGLPLLEKYWHNLYVDEKRFLALNAKLGMKLREILRFSTYQFITKVMHPQVVAPAEPEFMCGFNDAARRTADRYPTYESTQEAGLDHVLRKVMRPELERLEPAKLAGFDKVTEKVLAKKPNFSKCSHQVMFVFDA